MTVLSVTEMPRWPRGPHDLAQVCGLHGVATFCAFQAELDAACTTTYHGVTLLNSLELKLGAKVPMILHSDRCRMRHKSRSRRWHMYHSENSGSWHSLLLF